MGGEDYRVTLTLSKNGSCHVFLRQAGSGHMVTWLIRKVGSKRPPPRSGRVQLPHAGQEGGINNNSGEARLARGRS